MEANRLVSIGRRTSVAVLCLLCAFFSGVVQAGNEPLSSYFELGDSLQPEVPGTGDLQGSAGLPGPDWADLFRPDGSLRDEVGANGQSPGNGVPDFIDLYQGQAAVFVADDVSAGTKIDFTVPRDANHVDRGVVPNVSDELSNAYAYLTNDAVGRPLLFAGIERLNAGASTVELEFNQGLFRLGRGWPGRTGWEILGRRTSKDLLITLSFGADGLLSSVGVDSWEDLSGTGSFGWLRKETLTGEGCNRGDPNAVPPTNAGTVCAFSNEARIPGGGWVSYDAAGQTESILSADTFLEIGVNVGSLLGISDRTLYDYSTVQLRTPGDIAFGYFEGSAR